MKDFQDGRVPEQLPQKPEVKAGQGVEKIDGFPVADLDEAEFLPKITQGIVFRVHREDWSGGKGLP